MTDDLIKKFQPQCLALGRLYRIITDVTGYKPVDFDNACSYPLRYVTQATQRLHHVKKYSNDDNFVERMSCILLDQVDTDYAEYESAKKMPIPMELQGSFQIGFFRGVHDISMGARIMYLRRRGGPKGKADFARIIDVSTERLKALEEDKATPTEEELAKLAAHFNLDPIDITDCTSKYKDVVYRPQNLI